jgi:hypothetical protein
MKPTFHRSQQEHRIRPTFDCSKAKWNLPFTVDSQRATEPKTGESRRAKLYSLRLLNHNRKKFWLTSATATTKKAASSRRRSAPPRHRITASNNLARAPGAGRLDRLSRAGGRRSGERAGAGRRQLRRTRREWKGGDPTRGACRVVRGLVARKVPNGKENTVACSAADKNRK